MSIGAAIEGSSGVGTAELEGRSPRSASLACDFPL
jgi:hypothetical protein